MNPFLTRLKIAQQDLIAACGGIERAAIICRYGKSTVGRWNDRKDPSLMPLGAVVVLEAECRDSIVSKVMLHAAEGAEGADRMEPEKSLNEVNQAFSEVMSAAAMLAATHAAGAADGDLTGTERQLNDRAAQKLESSVKTYRNLNVGLSGPRRVVGE